MGLLFVCFIHITKAQAKASDLQKNAREKEEQQNTRFFHTSLEEAIPSKKQCVSAVE